MKVFDEVKIAIEVMSGAIYVIKFTIICEIDKDNHIYGLTAQNRVVVGQHMADNTWKLSDSIDLMDVPILGAFHEDVTEKDLESNLLFFAYLCLFKLIG